MLWSWCNYGYLMLLTAKFVAPINPKEPQLWGKAVDASTQSYLFSNFVQHYLKQDKSYGREGIQHTQTTLLSKF